MLWVLCTFDICYIPKLTVYSSMSFFVNFNAKHGMETTYRTSMSNLGLQLPAVYSEWFNWYVDYFIDL